MRYRNFGDTGIKVSELGIGVWSLATDWWSSNIKAEDILKKSYEFGINFFDTADIYGEGKAEEVVGKVLGAKRDNIVILTKVGYNFYNKKSKKIEQSFDVDYLRYAVLQSMKRLNTDYIDILMLHNPRIDIIRNSDIKDFLFSLKKDGIARSVGIALGPTLGWGEEGIEAIKMGYEGLEHIFNLIEQNPGLEFLKYKIGQVIRVPHASDSLIEDKWPIVEDKKLHRSLKDIKWIQEAVNNSKEILTFAKRKGMKLSQLALKFDLYFSNVSTVTPNITSLNELEEYVKVEDLPDLSADDIQYISDYYNRFYKYLNDESIRETTQYK
ncbi:aldo/keto reductase [Candidatus Acidianus copahuensis]|uniref:Aldo/keto reductase n=1 Tax=Candidatus Acidianus copahuensis TaxID=1160895 RepID=A0A031LLP2_9CREN|nr:aldo/keto reductase [Candidatus Acidianus copahuensis]EZQ03127.1 aldo/keto reductase [Candidatus Acidianus copahuensis]